MKGAIFVPKIKGAVFPNGRGRENGLPHKIFPGHRAVAFQCIKYRVHRTEVYPAIQINRGTGGNIAAGFEAPGERAVHRIDCIEIIIPGTHINRVFILA